LGLALWVARAEVVALVFSVLTALGGVVGFCSGRTVAVGVPEGVVDGLSVTVAAGVGGWLGGTGVVAADALVAMAATMAPVARVAPATEAAVRASTSRTARSRRRPEG
jgi:hypothetical protein